MTNPEDGTIGPDDRVTLEVEARVTDAAGASLAPTATLDVEVDGEALPRAEAGASLTVTEPNLSLDLDGPVAVDPGGVAAYAIRVVNDGDGPAYGVSVADPLTHPELSLVAGSVVVRVDGAAVSPSVTEGEGFSLTLPVLAPGAVLEVAYEARLDPGADPSRTYPNEARATYASAPSAGRPGAAADDHAIAAQVTIAKSVVATSDPGTGAAAHDPARLDLAIGEEATFEIVLTLPEVAFDGLVVTDALPPGLDLVSTRLVSVGAGIAGLEDGVAAVAEGRDLRFDLGALDNPSDGSIGADDRIVLEVVARAADPAASGDALVSPARLLATPEGGTALMPRTAEVALDVVEPAVSLDLAGPAVASPGGVVTYTARIANAGDGPAVDLNLADALDAEGLSYVPGSLRATLDGSDVTDAVVVARDGTGLRATLPALAPGAALLVTYDAAVAGDVRPAQSLASTAVLSHDTVPDGDPATPEARAARLSDGHRVTTPPSLDAEGAATTSGTEAGDPGTADAGVGEPVTFRFRLTLPEIDFEALTLSGALDPGLELLGARIVSLGEGMAAADPDPAALVTGPGGFDLALGSLANPFDGSLGPDDVLTVEVTARVADLAEVVGGLRLGTTLTAYATAEGGLVLTPITAAAFVEVVEPALSVDLGGPLAAAPGETVPLRAVVTNTGSGAAFDVAVADALEAEGLSLVPGSVRLSLDGEPAAVDVAEGDGFRAVLPRLAAGSTLTVDYLARLDPDAPPAEGALARATVSHDTMPGAEPGREGTAADEHRVAGVPELARSVVATGLDDTGRGAGDPALLDLAVGEAVTTRLVLTLPEIALDDVVLSERLGPGLELVSARLVEVGEGLALGGDPLVAVRDGVATLDLGRVLNPADGSIGADDRIVVELVTRVADRPGVADGVRLTPSATLAATAEGGPLPEAVAAGEALEVVEPRLETSRAVDDPRPSVGDVVTYTVTVTNPEGSGSAGYDLLVAEDLPAGLVLVGTVRVSDPDLAAVVEGEAGGTAIRIAADRLPPGTTLVIEYDVRVGEEAATPGADPGALRITGATAPDGAGRTFTLEQGGGALDVAPADPPPVAEPRPAPPPVIGVPVATLSETPVSDPFVLGIDDEAFLPVLSIDPILSGRAEAGGMVALTLESPSGVVGGRTVLAGTSGGWIAVLPRIVAGEDGRGLGDDPLLVGDDPFAASGEDRRVVIGSDAGSEGYSVSMATTRPALLPLGAADADARLFYGAADLRPVAGRSEVLRVDEVFEDAAGLTVRALYEGAANPLGPGLNRFNVDALRGRGGRGGLGPEVQEEPAPQAVPGDGAQGPPLALELQDARDARPEPLGPAEERRLAPEHRRALGLRRGGGEQRDAGLDRQGRVEVGAEPARRALGEPTHARLRHGELQLHRPRPLDLQQRLPLADHGAAALAEAHGHGRAGDGRPQRPALAAGLERVDARAQPVGLELRAAQGGRIEPRARRLPPQHRLRPLGARGDEVELHLPRVEPRHGGALRHRLPPLAHEHLGQRRREGRRDDAPLRRRHRRGDVHPVRDRRQRQRREPRGCHEVPGHTPPVEPRGRGAGRLALQRGGDERHQLARARNPLGPEDPAPGGAAREVAARARQALLHLAPQPIGERRPARALRLARDRDRARGPPPHRGHRGPRQGGEGIREGLLGVLAAPHRAGGRDGPAQRGQAGVVVPRRRHRGQQRRPLHRERPGHPALRQRQHEGAGAALQRHPRGEEPLRRGLRLARGQHLRGQRRGLLRPARPGAGEEPRPLPPRLEDVGRPGRRQRGGQGRQGLGEGLGAVEALGQRLGQGADGLGRDGLRGGRVHGASSVTASPGRAPAPGSGSSSVARAVPLAASTRGSIQRTASEAGVPSLSRPATASPGASASIQAAGTKAVASSASSRPTSTIVSPTPTASPGSRRTRSTVASNGARRAKRSSVASSSRSSASARASWSPAISNSARAVASAWRARSASQGCAAPRRAAASTRASTASASATATSARRRAPSAEAEARATATRASCTASSIRASTSPSMTRSPSATRIASIRPGTAGRSSACCAGSRIAVTPCAPAGAAAPAAAASDRISAKALIARPRAPPVPPWRSDAPRAASSPPGARAPRASRREAPSAAPPRRPRSPPRGRGPRGARASRSPRRAAPARSAPPSARGSAPSPPRSGCRSRAPRAARRPAPPPRTGAGPPRAGW